jgi:L-rhamnose mutarotase
MPRLHFALDLKDDPALIAAYEAWHRPEKVWPEIPRFLRAAGIRELEIFRCGNRLVMTMDVAADFSAERYAELGNSNVRVQAWEKLMGEFQRALPFSRPDEKWIPMAPIFSLQATLAALEPGK